MMKGLWVLLALAGVAVSAVAGYGIRQYLGSPEPSGNAALAGRSPALSHDSPAQPADKESRTGWATESSAPRPMPAIEATALSNPILDPNILLAQAASPPPPPVTAPAALPATPPPALLNTPKIVKVAEVDADTNDYVWDPLPALTIKLRSTTGKITVGNVLPGQIINLLRTDVIPYASLASATATTSPTVDIPATQFNPVAGGYQVEASVTDAAKAASAYSQERIQIPSAGLADPTITETSGNLNAPTTPWTAGAVYSVHDGFLRLKGKGGAPGTRIYFVVQDMQTVTRAMRELTATNVVVRENGDWTADLNLVQMTPPSAAAGLPFSLAPGTTHKLWVRAEVDLRHRYSQTPLQFTMAAGDVDLPKATGLALAAVGGVQSVSQDVTTKMYWGSAKQYQVTMNVTNASALDGVYILLYDDAAPGKLIGSAPLSSTLGPIHIDVPSEGTHHIYAVLTRGQSVGPRSDPIDLTLRTSGLRVKSVQPTNFGVAPGVQALTVQFPPENRLSAAEAVTPANYALRRSKGTGAFNQGTDVDASSYLVGAPAFDPLANTVVLKFNELPVDIYQLEIKSAVLLANGAMSAEGLRDIYGNPIEDENGNRSKNYIIVLGKPTVDGSLTAGDLPSVSRGITGQSGKYVAFPEYTPPPTPVVGVNPSDKVETRVARLYYYRDAHRVAQIVNRNVKSYNYEAVAVRRRLADKARDVANQLTDDRRADERKAVQAAQEAREAEKALEQAQAALAQAKQQANQAGQTATAQNPQIDQTRVLITNAQASQAAWQDRLTQLMQTGGAAADLTQAQQNLAQATATLNGANTQLGLLTASQAKAAADANAKTGDVTAAENRVQTALAAVQAQRNIEVGANEKALAVTAQEDRSREEQFRREVAAAHEDPDTYAPGDINSEDPVQKCSISVIGEGEIQLRGPVKGMNVIRTMINQIDAPVGQVRVAIHTAQINGEHENRMEIVASRIQKYIDHSRFLTTQSAQMLRKAVVVVASRRAEQALATCAPGSQAERDQKYLYAFFGQDFIQELDALDSEFLKSGNKLLSLHSMDSTSLSSALFLMALAKNSVRHEILMEFHRMMDDELPAAEMTFIEAAAATDKDCKKFPILANNAKFQSLQGFFDADVSGDDTMTPIQREFVRLAQIFKNRLVTELEYKQRVMERTIIEERFGKTYEQQVKEQQDRENTANALLTTARAALDIQRPRILSALTAVNAQIEELPDPAEFQDKTEAGQVKFAEINILPTLKEYLKGLDSIQGASALLKLEGVDLQPDNPPASSFYSITGQPLIYAKLTNILAVEKDASRNTILLQVLRYLENRVIYQYGQTVRLTIKPSVSPGTFQWEFQSPADRVTWNNWVDQLVKRTNELNWLEPLPEMKEKYNQNLAKLPKLKVIDGNRYPDGGMTVLHTIYNILNETASKQGKKGKDFKDLSNKLLGEIGDSERRMGAMFQEWTKLRGVLDIVAGDVKIKFQKLFAVVDDGFSTGLQQDYALEVAERVATENRHPLDHKKLLDMLIDEVEDKYIDLLEGTRAHTANIDNYIKAVSTALDDDFQTQFYLPAFRGVREASTFWDVNLGKVETTSILTNNRAFAKVSPEATMEFDLPKRDIAIAEAMNGSMAMIQTYGALLQDPTFLALTKLNSGQPASSPVQGAAGGLSVVRNVLPGLPSSTDENVLSQAGPGQRSLAAPLEALIPDPAVYKFETGTGYEIRPVIGPDGQTVVFHFQYMYTTDVREPIRADEKHLGRVKRHFIDTDVQLSNYELREISRYVVSLKASRTSRGVPLFEDIPGVGVLFRPLPSAESSLQENVIMGQTVIFPTLFDLMGLRWAPAVADLDPLRTRDEEFTARMRLQDLKNHTFDYSTSRVDEFLRIPPAERRTDLYRSQETIPYVHPNGYSGPGLNLRDSHLREGYDPQQTYPETRFVPGQSPEDAPLQPGYPGMSPGRQFIEHLGPGSTIISPMTLPSGAPVPGLAPGDPRPPSGPAPAPPRMGVAPPQSQDPAAVWSRPTGVAPSGPGYGPTPPRPPNPDDRPVIIVPSTSGTPLPLLPQANAGNPVDANLSEGPIVALPPPTPRR